MFSKVYWVGCDADRIDSFMAHYDAHIVPAVQNSEHHLGHHLIQADAPNRWMLVANYKDAQGAETAAPMVQELVKPMAESYGMTLEVIVSGDVTRSI